MKANVFTMIREFRDETGREPRYLVVDRDTYDEIRNGDRWFRPAFDTYLDLRVVIAYNYSDTFVEVM